MIAAVISLSNHRKSSWVSSNHDKSLSDMIVDDKNKSYMEEVTYGEGQLLCSRYSINSDE